jgi:hypothetical protein
MALSFILIISTIIYFSSTENWGFYAHSLINRIAVYSLPPELIEFYKPHIQFITEKATNPDRRRYAVEGEAEKHYIDLDKYGENWSEILPEFWFDAVEKFSEDSLRTKGIGPWSAYLTFINLTKAFEERNENAILKLSADLGHYLADLNVPLHTTENYNGQLTGQEGIHGFWESRIPELQASDYQLWVGKAEYVEKPQRAIWEAVGRAHSQVDSVLQFERILTSEFGQDQKYSFEERNNLTVRVYSKEFTEAFAQALDHQVERQMKNSIKMIADFWFTAWVNAGQPDLKFLNGVKVEEEDLTTNPELKVRDH